MSEPWKGYRQMSTIEVLSRLDSADDVQLSLVHLYETTHRNRRAILDAVERAS